MNFVQKALIWLYDKPSKMRIIEIFIPVISLFGFLAFRLGNLWVLCFTVKKPERCEIQPKAVRLPCGMAELKKTAFIFDKMFSFHGSSKTKMKPHFIVFRLMCKISPCDSLLGMNSINLIQPKLYQNNRPSFRFHLILKHPQLKTWFIDDWRLLYPRERSCSSQLQPR